MASRPDFDVGDSPAHFFDAADLLILNASILLLATSCTIFAGMDGWISTSIWREFKLEAR
jgi:hypothetical protein